MLFVYSSFVLPLFRIFYLSIRVSHSNIRSIDFYYLTLQNCNKNQRAKSFTVLLSKDHDIHQQDRHEVIFMVSVNVPKILVRLINWIYSTLQIFIL